MAASSADVELVDTVRKSTVVSDVHELSVSRQRSSIGTEDQSDFTFDAASPQSLRKQPRLPLDDDRGEGNTSSLPASISAEASESTLQATKDSPGKPHDFELLFAVLLSAVAGFVDTAGVLALYGLFTAHVTGGLVSVGLAIAYNSLVGSLAKLSMIVVFVAAVAGTTLFARRVQRGGKTPLTWLLTLLAVALALFSFVGIALEDAVASADCKAAMLIGATAVAAMAVQNTLMRNALHGTSPTTFMTGNLTQVTIDAIEYMLPSPATSHISLELMRHAARQRLVKFGAPLGGFLVGVCAGAVATHALGLGAAVVPTVTVAVMAVCSWRCERNARPTYPFRHTSPRRVARARQTERRGVSSCWNNPVWTRSEQSHVWYRCDIHSASYVRSEAETVARSVLDRSSVPPEVEVCVNPSQAL